MATLAEYRGQMVNLDVHASKDYQFKKPLVSTQVEVTFQKDIAPLFSQINVWGTSFKVNCEDVNDIHCAKQEFLSTLNELNEAFTCFSSKNFVLTVFRNLEAHLEQVTNKIRNQNGAPIPAYQYKTVMQSAIESVLSDHGMSPKCNIGNGTLYNGDRVLVNSGVTSVTNLTRGLFSFFGFSPQGYYARQYEMLREKLIRCYGEGTWLNKVGDKPLILAYKVMLLSAFESFLTTIMTYLAPVIQSDLTCTTLKDAALENIQRFQSELDVLLEQKEIGRDSLLGHPLVCENEEYKQVVELGLGEAALTAFYEYEAAGLLLNHIAQMIGADSVDVVNPYKIAKEQDDHGYVDEEYRGHLPLPGKKVRDGMARLKLFLESNDSLISHCFDKDKLHINVSSTSSSNPNTGESYNSRQWLSVNYGIYKPIAGPEETVVFTFKD